MEEEALRKEIGAESVGTGIRVSPRNRANGQDESTVEANALCQT
jgi:hypothetical protein